MDRGQALCSQPGRSPSPMAGVQLPPYLAIRCPWQGDVLLERRRLFDADEEGSKATRPSIFPSTKEMTRALGSWKPRRSRVPCRYQLRSLRRQNGALSRRKLILVLKEAPADDYRGLQPNRRAESRLWPTCTLLRRAP